ncbi:MAG: Rrf2 family transcriptional regulator [Acidimicrobiia bacterium]
MRLEISRRADLATRALVTLSETTERMKASELARVLDTTPGFLSQAMSPLVARGWVRSVPGPSGGYAAGTDLERVSVLAVIEAVEGPTDVSRCVLEARECSGGSPCALHEAWQRARGQLLAEFAATSVASTRTGTPAPRARGVRRNA